MSPTAIELDGFDVSADDVIAVARQGASVVLSAAARQRLIECRRHIEHIPRRRLRSDDGLRCARFHQGVR